jgi:hypothetical protein
MPHSLGIFVSNPEMIFSLPEAEVVVYSIVKDTALVGLLTVSSPHSRVIVFYLYTATPP